MDRHLEKIRKVERHLQSNPKDYQSVIALLKLKSQYTSHQIQKSRIERLRQISEVRRRLDEKRT